MRRLLPTPASADTTTKCARRRSWAASRTPREHRELGVAADDGRAGTSTATRGSERRDRDPRVDRLAAPLHLLGTERLVRDDVGRRGLRGRSDDDLARRGERLEPARGVHRVAHGGDLAAERTHDHLARVHADTHLDVDTDALRERRQRALHLEPAAHRPLGVVLVRDRSTEDGDDLVADDLVDAAAVRRHIGGERGEARVDEPLHLLRVGRLGHPGEAHEVGEHEGRHPSLVGTGDQRMAAGGTEACFGGNARPARRAVHEARLRAAPPRPGSRSGASCRAPSGRLETRAAVIDNGPMATRLTDAEVEEALRSLPGWARDGDTIVKLYEAESFPANIEFVGRIADLAEGMNHHPDLDIRYTKLRVALSTHDAGGLTRLDVDLAGQIDDAEG